MISIKGKSLKVNGKRGVSLLELLIYIALLSVIMVVITTSFLSITKGRGKAEAQAEVHAALRFAIERLTRDIKEATAVTTPSCTPSCAADANATASTLVMTVGGQTVTYDVAAGELRRKEGSGLPQSITASTTVFVSQALFSRLENANLVPSALSATTTSIRVGLSARYNSSSPDYTHSVSATTTVTLR